MHSPILTPSLACRRALVHAGQTWSASAATSAGNAGVFSAQKASGDQMHHEHQHQAVCSCQTLTCGHYDALNGIAIVFRFLMTLLVLHHVEGYSVPCCVLLGNMVLTLHRTVVSGDWLRFALSCSVLHEAIVQSWLCTVMTVYLTSIQTFAAHCTRDT